jgi:hypothetical protein
MSGSKKRKRDRPEQIIAYLPFGGRIGETWTGADFLAAILGRLSRDELVVLNSG